jgi:DHA1 family tetracycline resistance protein-like MFS transporter
MPTTTKPPLKKKMAVAWSRWQRWVEPWYLAYALLGVTAGGLIPILLPLAVSRVGSAVHIGLVMAAVNLGGLSAPLWGGLADKYRLHRGLLAGGLLVATIALAVFPFTTALVAWLGLALLQGAGTASAATVANLFVVEAHPRTEWDERIAWLQTFYGGGKVGGLLLVAALSQAGLRIGLLTAGGLTALAALLGSLTTQASPGPVAPKPVLLQPARHSEWAFGSPQRFFHHLTLRVLQRAGAGLRSPFGLFLAVWLIAFSGTSAFFSLYPVLMQKVFGIVPVLSSVALAIASGLGLAFYTPAGQWSDRFGPRRVLGVALGIRLLGFSSMLVLGLACPGSEGWAALLAFTLVMLSWSLLIVSGTALAACLSTIGEGEGMGIFNTISSLAGVIGAALGGWAAGHWGYVAALGLAVVSVAFGLVLTTSIPPVNLED